MTEPTPRYAVRWWYGDWFIWDNQEHCTVPLASGWAYTSRLADAETEAARRNEREQRRQTTK